MGCSVTEKLLFTLRLYECLKLLSLSTVERWVWMLQMCRCKNTCSG